MRMQAVKGKEIKSREIKWKREKKVKEIERRLKR